jgi:endonuclease/exonuclease/phosphatase family metal-dependent hydrolase
MKTTYYIAWWNLENLFDVYNSTEREDWLARRLSSELKGWTDTVLQRKIDNLSKIIIQMNNNLGPDLLGVCEVENKAVLTRLVEGLSALGKDYGIVHHDMSDQRGIDVAFIYDKAKFDFEEYFSHVVRRRTGTRDLFQANFKTKSGKPLIVIGNHWPARSAGVYESEPYRIIAAETLSYWMQRIYEIRGADVPVLIMGDFNDEPFNRSITDYALASNARTNVVYARVPRLFNLMWPMMGGAAGTFYFGNYPYMIDQFMVSKEMVKATGKFRVAKNDDGNIAVKIEMFPEMISGGRYPDPISHGRPASKSSYNPDGYSDHYPISVVIGY